MTSGGNVRVAYKHEPPDDFGGDPTDDTFKTPGRNGRVQEVDLRNALVRQRNWNAQVVESIATTLEGGFQLDFELTGDVFWHDHLMAETSTKSGTSSPYTYSWGPITAGEIPSSRWYVAAQTPNGVIERELEGTVFFDGQITCQIGEPVTVTLIGGFATEMKNESFTPGSQPSPTGDPLIFHSGSLSIPDSNQLVRMQSATLNIANGGRFQRGWQRAPVAAVVGAPAHTLDLEKILTETDQLELAYGGTSSPADQVDGESAGELKFSGPGANGLTYNLSGVTPQNMPWNAVGDAESDLTEAPAMNVDSVTVDAESGLSEAR
jgi:hypothetical protein